MDLVELTLFVVGLALLIVGAEGLVRGASRLASAVGISPLVIGLTIVAFGTSAPELAVSIQSSLEGRGGIALGNVVGSNVFNVLLILGLSAIVAPLIVAHQLVRLDVPIMIGVSVLTLLFALDGAISRLEGALLFAGILGYTTFVIYQGRKEPKEVEEEYASEFGDRSGSSLRAWLINAAFLVGGLALLILGARWLVNGAVAIAEALDLSEQIIGLTIVAAGTSLPEVATSVVASIRGERDIAVGNVVGSNIFNILAVLGLASIVAPGGMPVPDAALRFDLPVMIAVAVACLPIFFTGHIITRWEGVLFLAYYIAYVAYLIMQSSNYEALPVFSAVMIGFVIPITVLTLALLTLRALRARSLESGEAGKTGSADDCPV